MIGTIILLFIIVAILISINVFLLYINLNYNKLVKKEVETKNKYLKIIEIQTKKEYNKIATLPIDQLNGYLRILFSKSLVLQSVTFVSEQNHNRDTELYAHVVTDMYNILGQDTISAIDFYYGESFLTKWMETNYRILEENGVLLSITAKKITVETLLNILRI